MSKYDPVQLSALSNVKIRPRSALTDEPSGQGYYLVPDNDPLWRASQLKRSFHITLDEENN